VLPFSPNNYLAWHRQGFALEKLQRFEEALASPSPFPGMHSAFESLRWCQNSWAIAPTRRFDEFYQN
jgi:hypothetical protein